MRSSAPQRLPASPSPQPAIVRELRTFDECRRPGAPSERRPGPGNRRREFVNDSDERTRRTQPLQRFLSRVLKPSSAVLHRSFHAPGIVYDVMGRGTTI